MAQPNIGLCLSRIAVNDVVVPITARLFLELGVALVAIGTALLVVGSFGGLAAVAIGLFLALSAGAATPLLGAAFLALVSGAGVLAAALGRKRGVGCGPQPTAGAGGAS